MSPHPYVTASSFDELAFDCSHRSHAAKKIKIRFLHSHVLNRILVYKNSVEGDIKNELLEKMEPVIEDKFYSRSNPQLLPVV